MSLADQGPLLAPSPWGIFRDPSRSSLERLEGRLKGYEQPILALTWCLLQGPTHPMGTVSWGAQLHVPDQACGAGGRLPLQAPHLRSLGCIQETKAYSLQVSYVGLEGIFCASSGVEGYKEAKKICFCSQGTHDLMRRIRRNRYMKTINKPKPKPQPTSLRILAKMPVSCLLL